MRILDEDMDKTLDRITLYLTKSEAAELKDALIALLAAPSGHHEHVPDNDFRKEITVCIYDAVSINQFDERSKRIITQDE